ncbi:MAG: neuromedin U, partial [Cyanobacteriota bacterium]|nr:neuromedin U [Cyanobacteriota bacterium]
MLFRLRMTRNVSWLFGLAALLVPTSVAAQGQPQTLVANPADFDFTPLELAELKLAQAPDVEQPSGTGNPPVAAAPDESPAQENDSLAQAAQNPIASLISVPIQWNSTPNTQWAPNVTLPSPNPNDPPISTNFKANQTQNVVNVQPVVPFKVNDGLTLVTRTIVPFISQPWARGTSIQAI